MLDFDDLAGDDADRARKPSPTRYAADGWLLFAHAWRPQIARGAMTLATRLENEFAATREALGIDIAFACCPHDAGPPICWCRKPLPGSILEFAIPRGVALERSVIVGSSAADRTMAQRLGVTLLGLTSSSELVIHRAALRADRTR